MAEFTQGSSKNKGFQVNQDNQSKNQQKPKSEQADSTSQQASSVDPETGVKTTTVLAEVADIQEQVNAALQGQKQGVSNLVTEYHTKAAPMADQAALEIYDMLSGHSFYRNIGASVAALMCAHPTRQKAPLEDTPLKRISFTPLNPDNLKRLSLNAGGEGSTK